MFFVGTGRDLSLTHLPLPHLSLQNLQKISNQFKGYEVSNVVEGEIQKVVKLTSQLPSVKAGATSFSKKTNSPSTQTKFPAYTNIKRKQISNPPATYQPTPSIPPSYNNIGDENSFRVCVDCGTFIPKARVELMPNVLRCVRCQSAFEKTHDTRTKVNEGFGGSREDVRKMKAKQWGEMANRGIIGMGKGGRKKK